MLGSVRWNLTMGAIGLLLAFIFSLGNNDFVVSILRGVYAFAAFFLLGYMLRGALHIIVGSTTIAEQAERLPEEDPNVGSNVDLTTPVEGEDLNQLLKSQLEGLPGSSQGGEIFKPFEPTRLVSTQNKEPEELVQAIRHLAEEGNDPR
jgi:hypothetical protein